VNVDTEFEIHNRLKPELPGDLILRELEKRNWTQDDLAEIIRRPRQAVNETISGKRGITLDMAVALADAFEGDPAFWMSLEISYRLSLVPRDNRETERRRHLRELGPIKEMQRRGWIRETTDAGELESELLKFFKIGTVNEEPRIGAVTRKSDAGEPLSPGQRAWCFRVRQLATAKIVPDFRADALSKCDAELRKIAAYPQEIYKVPQVLETFGIRYVIVEPLASCKVDGVAMWLDNSSPVIGMSLRYDRIDSFWFTLCHELSHVRHRDESPLDDDLTDQMATVMNVTSEMERRANEEAAATLIPRNELESFIHRVGPRYSKDRIVQFANRIKIYPGIIVGQLQHRKEIGYSANREMLYKNKVRKIIIQTATTDGWGHAIDPRSFQ
jgi:HTH-type transcriptional regulator / antitoxin HigA